MAAPGMSYYEYKVVIEEISKVCGSIGLSVAAHNSLCTGHILKFANEEQRKSIYLRLATAEWIRRLGIDRAQHRKRCGKYEVHRR